jgi:hypothetical protein
MAAQVGNDHELSGGKMLEHRLEHLAADHQPMHQKQGWSRSALGEIKEL